MPEHWIAQPNPGVSYPEALLLHFTVGRKTHQLGLNHWFKQLTARN